MASWGIVVDLMEDEIGTALGSRTVAADAVTALAQRLGRESRSTCHQVHVPAALAAASRR